MPTVQGEGSWKLIHGAENSTRLHQLPQPNPRPWSDLPVFALLIRLFRVPLWNMSYHSVFLSICD